MSQIEDHYDSIIDTKPDNDCVAGKTPRECVTEGGYQKQEDTDNDDARGRDTGDEDYVSYCVNDSNVYMTVEVDTSKESHKDDTDLYEEYKTNDSSAPIYEIVDEGAMPIVEESGELSKTIKRKLSFDCTKNTKIKVLTDDIRVTAAHIIVCPEYKGKPHGGVFGLSVKFTYWKAVKIKSLRKVNAEGRVARSICHKYKEYQPVKFLYHVNTPIWRDISDNTDLQKSVEGIFLKLNRLQSKERSIAIPLLGIVDVQDQDVVRECCRVFVRSVIKCCRERNNRLPLDVYLVNNCPILTSWISEDLAAFSE
ncbi:uncharacterized protein LOC128211025 isoform X2 [Mya arenaria]|uniref:uncharacterized protein LOC128211025 isoform X2 n=1 Tax=Mya arenaria TaxID=6604 RepID=UPI0022E92180|nr:uncharacterized protein LOC128211025 isoform X2 [Mya arenaria]